MTEENLTKQQLENIRNKELKLGVEFIGSAGAGKSTYLGGLHRVLGYGQRGLSIERGKLGRPAGKIITNSQRGINRSNATHSECDRFEVYCLTKQGIILANLFAPGGHRMSTMPEEPIDACAYFFDLSLLDRARQVVQLENFEFFPLKENRGSFFGISDKLDLTSRFLEEQGEIAPRKRKDSEFLRKIRAEYELVMKQPGLYCDPDKPKLYGLRYAACRAFALELYKEDELGIIIESLLDSELKLENRLKLNLPVIGIQTHDIRTNQKLEQEIDIQKVMNQMLAKYRAYISEKGYPYKNRFTNQDFANLGPVSTAHNSEVNQLEFKGIRKWHLVDSHHRADNRNEILNTAHSLVSAALEKRNYDSAGLRLIRFSKKHSDEQLTIHYDKL